MRPKTPGTRLPLSWSIDQDLLSPARRVLRGPFHFDAQFPRGFERPIRLAQHFPAHQNNVRLALTNDLVRLPGFADQANGGGRQPGFMANALGEGDLVAGRDGNDGARNKPPEEQSTKSTPSGLTCRASSADCAMSQPPSTQSVAEMRINNGRFSGHTRRTAWTVSRTSRARFSREPP